MEAIRAAAGDIVGNAPGDIVGNAPGGIACRAAGYNLRLYPDPRCEEFRAAAAGYFGLKKEQVFAGNGSDEILAFCFPAFFNPDDPILFPDIGYSFYPVYADFNRQQYRNVFLDDDFRIPVEAFMQPNGGIIFANPNAPTGICLPLKDVRRILDGNPDVAVIIDEAYVEFGGESAAGLIDHYPNLLVVQTLSKSRSLAGLRVAVALGHEDLITALDMVKNSFNSYTMDRLALAGGTAAFGDTGHLKESCRKIIATRERIRAELLKLGAKVIDSSANFLFIGFPGVPGSELQEKLRGKGILVRHFNAPRIDGFVRVSIGTDDEMDAFLKVIHEVIHEAVHEAIHETLN